MTERNTLVWILFIAFSIELLMLNQFAMLTSQWTWVLGVFAAVATISVMLIADIYNENIESFN